jgi:predicted aspartyl protease
MASITAQRAAADAAYREGRFSEAENGYLEIIREAPNDPTILEKLGSISLFGNRTREAEGFYTDALRATPRYRNIWPFNAQLKYRLALTCYRRDDLSQAARLFREASGPIAFGPFKELRQFSRHMAIFDDCTPNIIEGPTEDRANFIVTDPLPVIEVVVDDERKYFIIDTGGSEVILDGKLADEIGVVTVGKLSGEYAGKKKAETGLGRVDSIGVGGFTIKNMPVHILDTGSISTIFDGLEISGIIGTRLLMHFISTVDYVGAALHLRRRNSGLPAGLETGMAEGEIKSIPFWLVDTHYIMAMGTVNDLGPMMFFVDTGLAGAGFTAEESTLEEAGIKVDWTSARDGIGGGGRTKGVDIKIDRLTLGEGANEIVEMDVPGKVIEHSVPVLGDQLGFHVGGLISHSFFRKHSLTMDFDEMRLLVQ